MAVHGPYTIADSNKGSLVERTRMLLKDPFVSSMVVWVAIVSITATAIKSLLPEGILVPSASIFTCIIVLAGTAGLLASLYCFTIFLLTRQLNYLLLAMAFSTMGSGSVLQTVLDISYSYVTSQGWLMIAAWLFSGILFTGAAYTRSSWKASNHKQSLIQAIAAALIVLLFPFIAIPYVHNSYLILSLEAITATFSWSMIGSAVSAIALILLVTAISGHFNRARLERDRLSSLLCYFLVPYAAGVMCSTAAVERFDEWWVVGQVLLSSAWGVFIIVGSIENAFAHKDAAERLTELEMLHDISWSLVGAGTFCDLLEMLATTIKDRLHASVAVVYLADEKRERLEVAAVSGPDDYPVQVGKQFETTSINRWPGFHSGHTVKALFSAQTQIVNDVFIDVEFVPWKYVATDDGCAVSLPLVHQGTAIGVVNIYFTNWRQLTRQRLKLLNTIAAAATPAIENARVQDELQNTALRVNELDAAA